MSEVSNKKLFCLACREKLSVKSSMVNGDIKSAKHLTGRSRLESQRKKDLEIVEALRSNNARCIIQRGKLFPTIKEFTELK